MGQVVVHVVYQLGLLSWVEGEQKLRQAKRFDHAQKRRQ